MIKPLTALATCLCGVIVLTVKADKSETAQIYFETK